MNAITTLVCIPTCEMDGTYQGDIWAQPWNIETVDRTIIGLNPETAVEGSQVSIAQGEDVPFKVVLSRLTTEMIAARVDDARQATRFEYMATVQPVRVTNWMAQAWVLLLVQMLGQMALYRIAARLGDCLIWYRDVHACDVSRWWPL